MCSPQRSAGLVGRSGRPGVPPAGVCALCLCALPAPQLARHQRSSSIPEPLPGRRLWGPHSSASVSPAGHRLPGAPGGLVPSAPCRRPRASPCTFFTARGVSRSRRAREPQFSQLQVRNKAACPGRLDSNLRTTAQNGSGPSEVWELRSDQADPGLWSVTSGTCQVSKSFPVIGAIRYRSLFTFSFLPNTDFLLLSGYFP